MLWLLKAFWRSIVLFGTWIAILSIAKDFSELPEALKSWAPMIPTQEHLLIIFSGGLIAWVFWTDVRPFVRNNKIVRALSGLRVDPPDILLAKKEIADFVVDHLAPCSGALYEATRVSSYVYRPQDASGNIPHLVKLGIMARFEGPSRISDLLDKEKMRQWYLSGIEDHLTSALSRYLAQASVLDLVCYEIVRNGQYEDKRNYPQKDGRSFIYLVKDWSKHQSDLEKSLNKLVDGSNFTKLKYAIRTRNLLKTNFNGKNISEFIEKHEALISKRA